jgi:quinol-cytochrome oxidoreductase complex cytochrome b subunit
MSETDEDKTIPFFPDHVRTEFRVTIAIIILAMIVGVLGLISPIGLGEPADPMNTPAHTKSEWYFLFLYQFLKYVPKTIGVLVPIVAVIVLLLWPFFDRKEDTHKARWRRIILSVILMATIITLTIMGHFS